MRLVVISALALTAGCASVGDIREKPVAARFESQRSVAELSSCLAGVLSQSGGANIRTLPIEKGVALAEAAPVNMWSTVTTTTEIEDLGSSRSITVRSVATYKPEDVERTRLRYSSCL